MIAQSRLLAGFTFLRWLALLGLFQGMANAATVQTIGPISFTPTTLAVGGTTTASATGGASGNQVTFSSSSWSGICTVSSGGLVTGVGVGACTVAANQAGNGSYAAAAQVTQTIAVAKSSQTIGAISFLPTSLAASGTTTASATATSGLTVGFTSSTLSTCTVSGSTVTGVAAGTCTITASQSGDANYLAATAVTQSIPVKVSQTIGTISFSPTTLAAGVTTTASATASSGLAVSFSSATLSICTVSGSIVTGVAVGTCTLAANRAGDGTFAAAPQRTQTIAVSQGSQTISPISFTPASLAVGGTTTASATATSGLAVSFGSASPAICTLSGSTVAGVAIGTCSIVANQAGNASYLAAQIVVENITVGLANQTIGPITFTPTTLNVGATAVASASATSGLPVSFSSSVTPTICSVSGTNGTVVAGDNIGTCTITASQDGFQNGIQNYNAAPSVQKDILVTGTTVSFNQDALTFDPQYVGTTSAPKIITLTNTGGGRLSITSILPTVNVFAVSGNTCGSRVAAGASCAISVTFSPAATGTRVGSIGVTSNSANGTDSFTVSGQGVASNAPICTLSATPASVSRGRSSTLTANCSPMPTSYSWTGGTCANTSAATCTVKPTLTTAYGVTGTNSFGSSTGSATVTVKPVDLTPILMLLLD